MKQKLCVIGAGQIFQKFHLQSILNLGKIDINYVVDLDFELASRVSQITNSTPSRRITPQMEFDICLIATPPSTRLSVFESILNKKCIVIFEKPLALDYETSMKIIELAKENNIKVLVAQTRRFFPNLRFIRKFINGNFFRPPLKISVFEGGIFGWKTESNYLNVNNKKDNGVINDIGSHIYDFILQVLYDNNNNIEFSEIVAEVDYPTHANNFSCEFKTNGIFEVVKVKLSRNILLSNKLIITDSVGNKLITNSAYSKEITVLGNDFEYSVFYDENGVLDTFENSFDLMWDSIYNYLNDGSNINKINTMEAISVIPMMRLIDDIVEKKRVSGEINLINM